MLYPDGQTMEAEPVQAVGELQPRAVAPPIKSNDPEVRPAGGATNRHATTRASRPGRWIGESYSHRANTGTTLPDICGAATHKDPASPCFKNDK